MPSLISHLGKAKQEELLADLNYLNLKEFQTFCKKHTIPYRIRIRTESGQTKSTKDTDRKSIVLDRIRHYLTTGKILAETCFPANIVRTDPIPEGLLPTDRLYYGRYDKKSPAMIDLLKSLTDGKFRNGAIARILAREFWTAGKAPTFVEFANAWSKADVKGLGYHPEAAWLTDRARGDAGADWKEKRIRKAKSVLKILRSIPLQNRGD